MYLYIIHIYIYTYILWLIPSKKFATPHCFPGQSGHPDDAVSTSWKMSTRCRIKGESRPQLTQLSSGISRVE